MSVERSLTLARFEKHGRTTDSCRGERRTVGDVDRQYGNDAGSTVEFRLVDRSKLLLKNFVTIAGGAITIGLGQVEDFGIVHGFRVGR